MTTHAELAAKLNGKLVSLANELVQQAVLIVHRGPLSFGELTETQITQLRVWVGLTVRKAAEAAMAHADERRYALPPPPPPTIMVTPQAPPGPDPRFDEEATTKPMRRKPRT